ncbi:MAG: 16S rRNA (cytidine(1402)-2'-O)-methyltransferase [Betaproteobacteria bacterium]|nr:16S rRNA (cytidine(1402)-2'-O)-methyltransferase [Betaproteobacteria bacterium]
MKSTLYVVATPIGNLQDITLRALDILRTVDVIAAEDTRNTTHLLNHFAIGAKLMAVHEHNEHHAAARLIEMLQSGKSVALVSDAGTPAVSDPGAHLVARVREAGLRVVPIPGANAAISAFSAAGITAPHFLFYGFLPHSSSGRKRELAALKDLSHTLVFYESPHRILASIEDLCEVLGGGRTVTIARELTKLFETIHTCTLEIALDWLKADQNRQKGEFVLLVSGAEISEAVGVGEEAQRTLQILLAAMPLKQAVKLAAEISGAKKNALYELALQLNAVGDKPDGAENGNGQLPCRT